jgi:outer membrane protein assembly factor BamB
MVYYMCDGEDEMKGRSYFSKISTRWFLGKPLRVGITFLTVIFAFILGGAVSLLLVPHQVQQSVLAANSTLTGNPLASGPGTQLTLSGKGFGASETVQIYWNYTGPGTGTLLTSTVSKSNGSFTANVIVPSGTPPGAFIPIAGVGQTSNITAIFKFYLYAPTLALAPLSGSAHIALTVSAFGFQGLESVQLFWNNGSAPILTATTNIFGYLAPASIPVPADTVPGSYPVKAVGQTSNIAITNTYVVVPPTTKLNLTSGPVGVSVNVSGAGYDPNEVVNLLWNYTGPGTGTTVATTNAGFAGDIHTSFIVPTATTGVYTIAVLGNTSGRLSQNTFTVSNTLASSPATTPPSADVTVTGTGFQANEAVELHWNSLAGTLLATATADINGNISQIVTTPSSATPGANSIVSLGQSSGLSFTAPVNIDTSWGDFGFDFAHHRQNTYEDTVGPANVANLKLKWTAPTASQLQASPVYANGTIYMGTYNGMLNAYDATTGNLKWSFDSHTSFQHVSSPLVDPATGIVVFGTVGTRDAQSVPAPFYALDMGTGLLKWSLLLPWNQFAFPTIFSGTVYVGISHASQNSALYAIDEISGHITWQYATRAGVWGAVATDTSTNTVFTGIGDPVFQVVALNATTGTRLWQFTVPHFHGDDDPGSGIVVTNDLVYVNSKNGSLYALHESDGTLAWSTPLGPKSSGNVSSPAVATNGMLYVGSHDHNLYTIDANTGGVLHKTPTGGIIAGSPAVANGVVYFASLDAKIYAMNATNGTILWSYATRGKSYCSPIMVNGWLYCASTDGKLYAFSL